MEQKKILRCAVYTRKSHEDGLEQEFNSLDAQRDAGENYIASQKLNGWQLLPNRYDDGGFSGGNMERPALKRLLADVEAGKIDIILVYKLDRLSRSLLDFMRLAEMLEKHNVSFVSVTQEINTSSSAGRMMLNILMTFAQYEREVIAERIRDKIAGAKKRGKYCGGCPVLGYDSDPETKKLAINATEAELVKKIFERYCQIGSARLVAQELNAQGFRNKSWETRKGKHVGGGEFNPAIIYRTLNNPLYIGQVTHYDKVFPGEQSPIISEQQWQKTQKLLNGNLVAGYSRKISMDSPFRGLLQCGHCHGSLGLTYTQKGEQRYVYYICEKDAKRATTVCPVKRIAANDLEQLIMRQLGEILRTPTLLAKTYFAAQEINEAEIIRLQAEQKELQKQQERLRDEILQVIQANSGDHQEETRRIKIELEETNRQLADIQTGIKCQVTHENIIEMFNSLDELWEELFPVERYRLLHLLMEKITVSVDGIRMQLKTAGIEYLTEELINGDIAKGA